MLPDLKVAPEHLLTFGTELENRATDHLGNGGPIAPNFYAILEGKLMMNQRIQRGLYFQRHPPGAKS